PQELRAALLSPLLVGTTRPPRGSRQPTPRSHLCARHRPLVGASPRAFPPPPPAGRAGATAAALRCRRRGRRPAHAPPAPSPSASPARRRSPPRDAHPPRAAPAHQKHLHIPTAVRYLFAAPWH